MSDVARMWTPACYQSAGDGTRIPVVAASDYDALAQRCRELEEDAECAGAVFMNKNAECIALRAEVEALRKDAERYRALRHSLSGEPGSTSADMPCICAPMALGITYTPDWLDLAIDSAMAASQ